MGELRGPVLWAETMSARSASAGDPGLFVCATTTKAYDTDENRVLKAALHAVHRAARQAEHGADSHTTRSSSGLATTASSAARLLEHQTLAQVPVVRPTGRALRRTRAGSRRHTYRPALALLRRAAEPMGADHLNAFADERTRAQHDLLAATIQRWEEVTGHDRDPPQRPWGALRRAAHLPPPGPARRPRPPRRHHHRRVLLDVPAPLHDDPDHARAAARPASGGPAIGAGDEPRGRRARRGPRARASPATLSRRRPARRRGRRTCGRGRRSRRPRRRQHRCRRSGRAP